MEKKVKMGEKVEVPVGVRVISVLAYILFCLFLIGGISFLWILDSNVIGELLFVAFIGILGIFSAYGLSKGKGWSRYIMILLCLLGFLVSFSLIISQILFAQGIFSLIIFIICGLYLLINKNVKNFFTEGKS